MVPVDSPLWLPSGFDRVLLTGRQSLQQGLFLRLSVLQQGYVQGDGSHLLRCSFVAVGQVMFLCLVVECNLPQSSASLGVIYEVC